VRVAIGRSHNVVVAKAGPERRAHQIHSLTENITPPGHVMM
jgi:hypothetical protein